MFFKKSVFFIFVFFIFSLPFFADDFTHNHVINLIRNTNDLDILEKMISSDESIVYDTSDSEIDCVKTIFDVKSNFESDTDFEKYAERLIRLLPDSYWITKNREGNYPIFTVLAKCDPVTEIKLINLAIERTSNLNIENDKHQTPLTYVATSFDRRGVSLLQTILNNGADVNYKNFNGYSAIMYAAEFNPSIEIFRELYCFPGVEKNLKNGNGETLSILASKNKNSDILEYLIEQKNYENITDFYGKTPLMHACEQERLENVKLLLNIPQDINQRDNYGKTALMYACEKSSNFKGIHNIISKKGTLFRDKDLNGNSAFYYLWRNSHFLVYKIIFFLILLIIFCVIVRPIYLFRVYVLNKPKEIRSPVLRIFTKNNEE